MTVRRQRGAALVVVVVGLALLASIALMLAASTGADNSRLSRQSDDESLHYIVESALAHASWQLSQNDTCTGYIDVPTTAFGTHSYAASVTPTNGSPVSFVATGILSDGTSRRVRRDGVTAYQAPVTTVLQPGSTGIDTATWGGGHSDKNFGATTYISVGNQGDEQTALLQFDMSSLPSGIDIQSAALELWLEGANTAVNGVVDAHSVNRAWVEGSEDNAVPAPGTGATYEDYDGQNAWTSAGGDHGAIVVDSVAINGTTPALYSWEIAALVNQWHSGVLPNNGLLLRASAGTVDDARFSSSDSGAATNRPRLTITYACPCGMACAGAGPTPVSHWKFDEAGGTTAEDSIGGNDGTLMNSPTRSTGSSNGGLSFDQVNDYVSVPDFSYSDDFTIAFDLKVDDNSGSLFKYIYSHGNINDTNSLNIFLNEASHGTDPNELRTVFRDSDDPLDNFALQFDASAVVGDGQWHTYTLTREVAGGVKVYLDGTLMASGAFGESSFDPAGDLVFGARDDFNADRYFGGLLDELRLFDRALDASEVADIAVNPDGEGGSSGGDVAHWKFDEGSGSVAADSVGGHDGTLTNNPTWTAGVNDGALMFDGSNDFVSVPHDNGLSLTEGMTFSAWIYVPSFAFITDYRAIVSTDDPGNGQSNYWFGMHGDEITFGFWASGGFRTVETAGVDVPGAAWNHIAATFDNATDEVLLYLNGTQVGSGTITYEPTTEVAPIYIGTSVDNELWQGSLDDVRINGTVLSAAEIQALAANGAHWKLDETSGIVAVDSIGSHDGTLMNGPAWTAGKVAGGLLFDGIDDYVEVPHDDYFSFSDAFTVSAWVRVDEPGIPATYRVLSKEATGSNGNYWLAVSGGWLYFGVGGSFHSPNDTFNDSTWYHIAASYSDTDNQVVIYVDGAEIYSAVETASLNPNTDPLIIGSNWEGSKFFDGAIDEVRLVDRALTPTEVAAMAGGGDGGGSGGCETTFADDFESGDYFGDTGTHPWLGPWVEFGDSGGAASGDERIQSDGSRTVLRVRDNDGGGEGVMRGVDMRDLTAATLTLWHRRHNLDDSGDYVAVEVMREGTDSWVELDRYEGGGSDSSYQQREYDIGAFTGGGMRLRLITSPTMGGQDAVFIDDVEICATR